LKTTFKQTLNKTIPENNGYLYIESPSNKNGESNGLVTESGDITLNELKENESKYRLLTENSMDGIYQVDLLGRFVYANRSFYEMLGYGEDEILKKHFLSIVTKRVLLKATKIVKNILLGNSLEDQIDLKRKDGSEFSSYFTATPLRKEGKIIGLTGSVKDIGKQKQIENEILLIAKINSKVNEGIDSTEIFNYATKEISKIFKYSTCDIYTYNRENNNLTLTAYSLASRLIRRIEKITGLTIKNMKIPLYDGSGLTEVIEKKQTLIIDSPEHALKDLSNNKSIQAFAWIVANIISFKFGARIPLIISDKVIGILGVTSERPFSDGCIKSLERFAAQLALIINKLHIDEQLKTNEKRLKDILDASPSAIIHTRVSDGKTVYANNSLANLLKLPLNKIIGQKAPNFYGEDNKRDDIINRLKHAENIKNETLKMKRLDGTMFWIVASMKLSKVEGETTIFTSLTDITEQKRTEKKLEESERTLENQVKERTKELDIALSKEKELNKLKTNFVSMASHEFRTPLTAILSASDNLKRYRDRMTETEVISKIDKIQSEVNGLTDILNDFLTVGTGETGKIELKVEKIDLKFFLNEEITSLKDSTAKEHDIDYVFDGPEIANLDPKLLKHIISNLLSNAVKYSEAGSKIEFHVSARNGFLTMQVNDQGIGIPKNDLEKIFTAFHRASNVGTIQGTGLGMTIVKQSVELHGGQIAIKSREGVGTKVEVVIPLYDHLNSKPIISNKRTSLSH